MAGFVSINTSVVNNSFCNNMRMNTDDTVCKKCYASRIEKFRSALGINLIENSATLGTSLLKEDEIPKFKDKQCVRFHSFGELQNDIHMQNFIAIANANPNSIFALFTKRLNMISQYGSMIPANVIVIASSPFLNTPLKDGFIPPRVDKIFTVYDKDHQDNIEINCLQQCNACMKCYDLNDKTKYINEDLR